MRENFNSSIEERIGLLLKDAYSSSFIPDDMSFAKGKEYVHRANIVTGKLEIVPVSVLSTLVQVKERVYRQIGQNSGLSADARRHVRRILESLMIPNLTFDESLTKIRQEEDARNSITSFESSKKGRSFSARATRSGRTIWFRSKPFVNSPTPVTRADKPPEWPF